MRNSEYYQKLKYEIARELGVYDIIKDEPGFFNKGKGGREDITKFQEIVDGVKDGQ